MIALAMFALAGMTIWRVDWPASRPWAGGAIVVSGAMAYTPVGAYRMLAPALLRADAEN